MIWIDNSAGYYISKIITVCCRRIELIHIDWPTQFPDLNSIKNL